MHQPPLPNGRQSLPGGNIPLAQRPVTAAQFLAAGGDGSGCYQQQLDSRFLLQPANLPHQVGHHRQIQPAAAIAGGQHPRAGLDHHPPVKGHCPGRRAGEGKGAGLTGNAGHKAVFNLTIGGPE